MTPHYLLHYAPDNASLCVRLALESLDLPYRTALVNRAKQAQKSPEYLRLNPNGLIPVLETPFGPIFETGAILLWLADTHSALMPEPANMDRGQALQWLIWLSNTLHTDARMIFYPEKYTQSGAGAVRAVAQRRFAAHLDMIAAAEDAILGRPGTITAHGCYLAPLLRWAALYGGDTSWFDLRRWPRLHGFAEAFEATPAAGRAANAEGLGPTPFSDPVPCRPPEGVAL